MAFEIFPYTDFHNLNLDWIMQRLYDVNKRLDVVNKRLDEVNNRLDEIEKELVEINKELESINEELTNINKLLAEIDTRLDGHDSQIAQLTQDLSTLKKNVDDIYSELNAKVVNLTTRVEALERKTDITNSSVTNVDNKVNTLTTILNTTTQNVQQNTTDIKALKVLTDNHTERLDNLASTVSQLTTNTNNLSSTVATISARLTNLENLLSTLDIVPPVQLIKKETDFYKSGGNYDSWWSWICDKLTISDSGEGFYKKSGWKVCKNPIPYVSTPMESSLDVGFLGQPTFRCKLPFMAVYENAFSKLPTLGELKESFELPYYGQLPYTPTDGFFNLSFDVEYGHTQDELKFSTSYIPFLPVKSTLVEVQATSGGIVYSYTKSIECGVRIQVPESGKVGKANVTTSSVTYGIVPHTNPDTSTPTSWDLVLYMIAENG